MFSYFYHEKIRKTKLIMQALFSNIYVVRKKADGSVINQQRVPVSYASKSKFIDRIENHGDLHEGGMVAMKLPRIAVEMTGMNRRGQHMVPKTNTFLSRTAAGASKKFYATIPYLLTFQVIIASKTEDDMHQILEQILPYFAPAYTATIKPFSDYPDIKEDLPIALMSVSQEDNYEGHLETRSSYYYYLDFEIHTDFYGPISDSKLIKKAIVDFTEIDDSDGTLIERITVTPDPVDADSDTGSYITTYIIPGEGDSI